MHHHLWLTANGCSIRYQKFPYLISDIRGTLETLDGHWSFHNLAGSHDKACIKCEGCLTPGSADSELVLSLAGQDVPLGEDLRDALSPHIQQVWHDLRPRGVVDLTAEIRYLSEQKTFSIGVRRSRNARTPRSSRCDFLIASTTCKAFSSTATATSPSRAARASTAWSRSPARATAISRPTGGGTCTSPGCRPIGSGRPRPRVDPSPAGTVAESRDRTEPHRPDQPLRQLGLGADRAAGRAAAMRAGMGGSTCSSRICSAVAFPSRTCMAK